MLLIDEILTYDSPGHALDGGGPVQLSLQRGPKS